MSGNFGRSVFQLRTDRSAFRSELSAAEGDARQSSEQIDRHLQRAADGLGEGARRETAEFDRHLDSAARRARGHSADIQGALGDIAGRTGLGALVGAAGPIAALVAGLFALVGAASLAGDAIGGLTRVSFDYNRNLQNATNLLVAYTGSQSDANAALRLAQREADAGRGSFSDLANAIAILTPSARASGESIEDLTALMEILAATNPAEGIQGAAIALREAASGDFTSVAERFNVSRIAIQRYRDDGVGNIEAVERALADMGITFTVVEQQSRSVDVLSQRLSGLGQRFAGESGAPVFTAFNAGLLELVELVSDQRIRNGSEQIAALFEEIGRGFERGFGEDELADAIDDLLDRIEEADLSEFAENMAKVAETAGLFATGIVRAADFTFTLIEVFRLVPGAAALARDAIESLVPGAGVVLGLIDFAIRIAEINQQLDELAKREGILGLVGRALGGGRGEVREIERDITPPAANEQEPTADPGDIERLYERYREEARIAALRAAQGFVSTFTEETTRQFQSAHGVLRDTLIAAVGGDETKITAEQSAQAYLLVARALSEIQARGFVTQATMGDLRREFGDNADTVIAYLDQIERLNAAQENYNRTVDALADAQANLRDVTEEVAEANEAAQAAVTDAENVQRGNQQAARDAADEQRRLISDLQREASETARRYQDITRALQDQADAARDAAEAAQEARQAQISAAQEELAQTRTLAQEHAAAFAAIQAGTVDQFLALNGEVDESTRRIIEAYGEQARAAIEARNAATERADEIGVEGRRRLLDLETQIRAARGAGNFAEAAALERQRDLERQRFQSKEAFARQQAAVLQDEVNAATEPIKAAAEAQAVADAAAERGAQAKLAALQEADKIARASEQAAIEAIEDEIAAVRRMAEAEAEQYRDRQQAIQDRITGIEDAARIQERADRRAIDDAKEIANQVKIAGEARITAARDARDLAITERDAAKETLDYQKEQLATIEAQIRALQEFMDANPGVTPWGFRPGYTPPPVPGGGSGGGELEASRRGPAAEPTAPAPQFATAAPQPVFLVEPTGGAFAFSRASGFGGPEFLRVPVPGSPTGAASGPLDLGGAPMVGRGGDTRLEFNAPLVTFPDLRVDSEERAQFVVGESIRGVRRALAGFVNAGPPTFRG